jgi:enoyl-CoA hydratase/carnithine racemase
MLELFLHCHYLVCTEDALLGMPEVTLPVVPGMEGCHWAFRKVQPVDYERLFELLLTGRPVAAKDAVGWLADYAAPLEEALKKTWMIAKGADHGLRRREVDPKALDVATAARAAAPSEPAAKAIHDCIVQSCRATLAGSLDIQARHSAAFMITTHCRRGAIGRNRRQIMDA